MDTYKIVCDNLGDIKVFVKRAITQNYTAGMPQVKPIHQWSCVGVAWKQRHDYLYNIHDIVKGGHAIICNVCEDSAVAYLMRLSREYSPKPISANNSAYPDMTLDEELAHGGV